MKQRILPTLAAASASVLIGGLVAVEQPQQGAERPTNKTTAPEGAAERALAQALAGPDGEHPVHAEYAAIVQRFGEVQPYDRPYEILGVVDGGR